MKNHEAVCTACDEIICCSETKAKSDHSPQHLPSLLSVRMGKNLGTGMKFTFPIRLHLTSPASHGGGVTDESHAFPQLPAFQGFPTNLMQLLHKNRKEESLHDASLFKEQIHATLPQVHAEGAARQAQHTRSALHSPCALGVSTGISFPGWGTLQSTHLPRMLR